MDSESSYNLSLPDLCGNIQGLFFLTYSCYVTPNISELKPREKSICNDQCWIDWNLSFDECFFYEWRSLVGKNGDLLIHNPITYRCFFFILSVFAGKYIWRKLDQCCVSFLRATSELKHNSNKFNAVALNKLFHNEIIYASNYWTSFDITWWECEFVDSQELS